MVCDTVFDENKDGAKWDDLPGDWICPVCDSLKSMFKLAEDSGSEAEADTAASAPDHAETSTADVQHSSKPGLEGFLPGKKVTSEIARFRGFKEGEDIISPPNFKNIRHKQDLKNRVDFLQSEKLRPAICLLMASYSLVKDR